jgi:WD40 repeat protein
MELHRAGGKRTLFTVDVEPSVAALSRDGSKLALGAGVGVEVYDPLSGRSLGRWKGGRARATALDWSPDGEALLIGAADGRIYRWRLGLEPADLSSAEWNRRYERYIGHATAVSAVRYHPFGRIFFTGDWDGEVSAWLDHSADPYGGQFDKDVLGGRFFTAKTPRVVGARAGGRDEVTAIAVSNDGERLVVAGADGTLEVWNVRGFKSVASLKQGGGSIFALALDERGAEFAVASRDGQVRRYAIEEQQAVALRLKETVALPGARALAYLRNGDLIGGDKRGRVVALR